MARFSEPKQKRSIMKQYGMYVVKTQDMCTYHKTFIEAVESYGLVYGRAPIAGPLEMKPQEVVVAKPDPMPAMIEKFKNQSKDLCEKVAEDRTKLEQTYVTMAETFERGVKSFEQIIKTSQAQIEISKELRQRMSDRKKYMDKVMNQAMWSGKKDEEAA